MMKHVAIFFVMFLGLCRTASAQTLEESLAFILSGAKQEFSHLKRIDDNRIAFGHTFSLDGLQNITLTVIDRPQCIVRIDGSDTNPGSETGYREYFFNNIIIDEIQFGPHLATFVGEQRIIQSSFLKSGYTKYDDATTSNRFAISVADWKMNRFTKAIKYVYSNFCHSAKRKSAF